MKNIISLVVIVSSISLAQTNGTKSLIELKQLSAVSSQQLAVHSSQQLISNQNIIPEKKNAALAILYSMLLPGMGELYADAYDSGKYFTIADGVLWGAFTGLNIYGNWQEKNYKSFAESKGGVLLGGKDSDYFGNIGVYLSIDDYNTAMELNRDFNKTYNTTTYSWKWSNDDQRKEYRNMWSSSENAFNNIRFVVGALILNRLISAVNAVRLVNAYNKNLLPQLSWNIFVGVDNHPALPTSITFNFIKSF